MILVNNSSSASKWTVAFAGGQLDGTVDPGKYHQIDSLPGNPPYSVGFTCAGIEGVKSKDAVVTFDSASPKRVQASYRD